MAYEFKKLSEVEAIEALSETANVLVEDGGAIKRVPSSAVGGSADEEYEMVLNIGSENTYLTTLATDDIKIESGDGLYIAGRVLQGLNPKVLVKLTHCYGGYVFETTCMTTSLSARRITTSAGDSQYLYVNVVTPYILESSGTISIIIAIYHTSVQEVISSIL